MEGSRSITIAVTKFPRCRTQLMSYHAAADHLRGLPKHGSGHAARTVWQQVSGCHMNHCFGLDTFLKEPISGKLPSASTAVRRPTSSHLVWRHLCMFSSRVPTCVTKRFIRELTCCGTAQRRATALDGGGCAAVGKSDPYSTCTALWPTVARMQGLCEDHKDIELQ